MVHPTPAPKKATENNRYVPSYFALCNVMYKYISSDFLKVLFCVHTFEHPHFWLSNSSMGASIEQPIWKVPVLVYHMTKEGLKFGQFYFSKTFLG